MKIFIVPSWPYTFLRKGNTLASPLWLLEEGEGVIICYLCSNSLRANSLSSALTCNNSFLSHRKPVKSVLRIHFAHVETETWKGWGPCLAWSVLSQVTVEPTCAWNTPWRAWCCAVSCLTFVTVPSMALLSFYRRGSGGSESFWDLPDVPWPRTGLPVQGSSTLQDPCCLFVEWTEGKMSNPWAIYVLNLRGLQKHFKIIFFTI